MNGKVKNARCEPLACRGARFPSLLANVNMCRSSFSCRYDGTVQYHVGNRRIVMPAPVLCERMCVTVVSRATGRGASRQSTVVITGLRMSLLCSFMVDGFSTVCSFWSFWCFEFRRRTYDLLRFSSVSTQLLLCIF